MHPAYSVILFTTASGAGYGLLVLLALTAVSHGPVSNWAFGATALVVSLSLIVFGLFASAVHLGRPERAWRAFSQWRSSWLSREGVLAVAAFVPILAFAAAWLGVVPATAAMLAILALTVIAMCAATVYCTGKIYSTIAAIPQWCDPLVVPVYLAMGLATGAVLLVFLAAIFALSAPVLGRLAAVGLAIAAGLKWLYFRRIDEKASAYTLQSATGLGHGGTVRQWEAPHTGANYLMKEMGYAIARRHAVRLRSYVLSGLLFSGAGALLSSLLDGFPGVVLAGIAAFGALVSALIERWLFFAEARHVSMLYYGASRV
jgi:sulfite dehydrogenase (quinone) subunit SoeC